MKKNWDTYVFWILFTELVGGLAGLITRDYTALYESTIIQPPLSPPAIVFPIVWSILYALMGISVARISLSPPSQARSNGLRFFFIQLALNFFWSIIFFQFQAFGLALLWLIVLWIFILRMIRAFYQVDPLAALLQILYLLWVTFAGYLTLGVYLLN